MKIYTEYPYKLVMKTKKQSVFIKDYRKYPFHQIGSLMMCVAWEFENWFMFTSMLKIAEWWHKLLNLFRKIK